MLVKVFEDIIKNKNEWLKSRTGKQFESNFELALKNNGFTNIQKNNLNVKNIISKIKEEILNKTSSEFIYLKDIDNVPKGVLESFVRNPYGSQNFPDFLVFTKDKIVPIEIKYSEKNSQKPVWNGNLPKYNAIYLFGVYNRKDITFFLGKDVLPMDEREEMVKFYDDIRRIAEDFQAGLREKYGSKKFKFDRGFDIYIRETYQQDRIVNPNAILNYFNHPDRKTVEQNVIDFCNNL